MGQDADRNGDTGGHEPEVDLPGLSRLREAVFARTVRLLPQPQTLRQDGVAGLTVAISNVPDGMASGLLAGVNPIYGLYASVVGPIVGGLLTSSALMVITNTSATALVAGQVLVGVPGESRDTALFLLVILAGLFQVLFGLLRFGQLTRFVSYSVMTGFLGGIAAVLVLSQLPTVTGYDAEGPNRIVQTIDLLTHLDQVHLQSILVALFTIGIAVVLLRTRLRKFGSLVAIIVPSVVVALAGLVDVQIVRDVGDIPGGVPMPYIPSLADFRLGVVSGALSLAFVVLVQGAGVSQSVSDHDGGRRHPSRDFIAQGAANVAAGVFRGVPVGGSLGATALNVVSGASHRWAAILAGVWMAVIVLGLAGAVERVAMPSLGAILILAGVGAIRPAEVRQVWQAGWLARMAGGTTFLATLVLPIQVAVATGVLLSALLYVIRSSIDVSVVQLVELPDGRIEERIAPRELPGGEATVLNVYGHIFYAGARKLERLLPRPSGRAPVVILRLRGHTEYGATLVGVLVDYADLLGQVGGRLYLSGIAKDAIARLEQDRRFHLEGPVRVYEATPIIGESTRLALADAEAWLARREKENGSEEERAGEAA